MVVFLLGRLMQMLVEHPNYYATAIETGNYYLAWVATLNATEDATLKETENATLKATVSITWEATVNPTNSAIEGAIDNTICN